MESIATAVATVAPAAIEDFCAQNRNNVQLINQSTDLAQGVAKLYQWSYESVTPAIVNICSRTKSPTNQATMASAMRRVQTALCGKTDMLNLPNVQLFVLQHFTAIVAVVVGMLAVLLIVTLSLSVALGTARRRLVVAK
jgi:hypothetical protein